MGIVHTQPQTLRHTLSSLLLLLPTLHFMYCATIPSGILFSLPPQPDPADLFLAERIQLKDIHDLLSLLNAGLRGGSLT